MSSDKNEDITHDKSEVQENEQNDDKNSIINNYSRNFTKCYNRLKFQKDQDNNNKNNNLSAEKIEENKNNINNNIPNTTISKSKNPFSYSLFDFDNEENASPIKKNSNLNKKENQEGKLNTNISQKNHNTNKNNNALNLSSSQDNLFSSNNNAVQTTTTQSMKIKNFKNKYLKTHKKDLNSSKSENFLNLKRTFSQNKFDSFLERVKEKERIKELHINNIRSKSLEGKNGENNNRHPEMCKKSILLLKNGKRKPLYQEKPLNEEKNMEKNFKDFYNKSLKENQTNEMLLKSAKNKNEIDEKYNNFYKDKMKWLKNVEQKNKNRKLDREQQYEQLIDKFSFKPSLNKNSLKMANKLNRNRSIDNFLNNHFYVNGTYIDSLDKFKTKLRPILNDINNYNYHMPYLNKRSLGLKRTLSEIVFDQKVDNEDENNKMTQKLKNKSKTKINYKLNEKKFGNQKNNNNYYSGKNGKIKKDKNKVKNKNINNNIDIHPNNKNSNLLKKIKLCENENENEKKNKHELYKLNISPGGAWNQEAINEIIPEKECNKIIENIIKK